ncbi:MAG TPA: cytochrome c oxidase subunit II [Burkholderiales bacterium]|nr:cytochrome c oxidase subunit II [Burkholderiales bacterium]
MMTNKIKRGIALLLPALYSGLAQSAYQLNLPQPETPIARQIFDLHTLILLVCVIIFCGVFGTMFYSIYKHRKSVGHEARQFHENTTVEIIWTIIPFFILIGMAYPATKTILAMKDASNPDMTIKVTGYQWKWGYDYLQDGVSFYSTIATPQDQIYGKAPKGEHYLLEVDKPLVVPVGKRVRVLITANDVIHSWWVPAFGVKQDAIPGFIRDSWFKVETAGTYRGQCAELCGKDHGFMPIVVEAKEQKDYEMWLAEQKQKQAATQVDASKTFTLDELKAQGEKVFNTNCAVCHQANGKGIPGAFPALDGSKIATGPMADHLNIVMNGKAGTAMVAFSKQLSDVELASVITYERNSWGNKAGDAIQLSEVKALRK